jgi:hypothetical protein
MASPGQGVCDLIRSAPGDPRNVSSWQQTPSDIRIPAPNGLHSEREVATDRAIKAWYSPLHCMGMTPSGRNLMLNHGSTSEPFIQSDNMKWRFAGQRAPAILDGASQADIVRALTLCRIMRRADDVRQTEKRLIDAELSMAYRLNPPGIDAGSEARVPH